MAYVKLGTKVSIPSEKIPSGFVAPAVTPFSGEDYLHEEVLKIPGTVATSNRSSTLLAIIQDNTNGVEKKIETKLSNDFDTTTNDVNVWIDMRNLDGDKCASGSNGFLLDSSEEYSVPVKVYVKITVPA